MNFQGSFLVHKKRRREMRDEKNGDKWNDEDDEVIEIHGEDEDEVRVYMCQVEGAQGLE